MTDKKPMTAKEREKLIQSSSRPMSDEERQELMRKLDEDLDAYVLQAHTKGMETPREEKKKSVDEIVEVRCYLLIMID